MAGTGEHGVGLGKREFLVEELGAGTVALMKAIKRTVDPAGLFNPGKVSLVMLPSTCFHFQSCILTTTVRNLGVTEVILVRSETQNRVCSSFYQGEGMREMESARAGN